MFSVFSYTNSFGIQLHYRVCFQTAPGQSGTGQGAGVLHGPGDPSLSPVWFCLRDLLLCSEVETGTVKLIKSLSKAEFRGMLRYQGGPWQVGLHEAVWLVCRFRHAEGTRFAREFLEEWVHFK